MGLEDHPGYFGLTSRGVIAIHADWPMYPLEHGWEEALLAFGSLPKTTRFFKIDDIDQCFLFVAGAVPPGQDVFGERFSHVAAWHEDIVELIEKSYIDGIELITEYDAALTYWEKHKDLHVEMEPGNFAPLNPPKPERNDESLSERETIPVISSTGLGVSKAGRSALRSLFTVELRNAPADFLEKVDPILTINKTDTAVREGCVLLESTMRQEIGSSQFGQNLVEEFCVRMLGQGAIPSFIKPFKAELKNAFRYIRNDYMHNLRHLELDEAQAILMRIARLYSVVRVTS
jgi:hypothetical protein